MSTVQDTSDFFERDDMAAHLEDSAYYGPAMGQPTTKASKDWSDTVVELAPDGIVIMDGQGRITLVNRQVELLFGYRRGELLGRPFEVLISKGFRATLRSDLTGYAVATRGWPVNKSQELLGRRADGGEFPVDIALAPIHVAGVPHIIATCRDATSRLQQENSLREQSELLTRTFDAMNEAVYIYDRAGYPIRMNAAARALGGYDTRPELTTRPPQERLLSFHPHDIQGNPLPAEAWPLLRVLRGETLTPEAPAKLLTTSFAGREQVTSVTGAPLRDADEAIVGAVVVSHDATEQSRLERELAARAREIESIFETDTDAVMLFDSAGKTLRMNAAQRRLLGYDATGRTDYVTPEQRAVRYAFADTQGNPLPKEVWPIYRVLRGETLANERNMEMRLRTQDGREIQVSVSGAPLRDTSGQIVGGVTATRDVTTQRQVERQRADILRVVAHDLANPIAAVSLYLQSTRRTLERGRPPRRPEEEREVLAEMAGAVTRMQRLVDDMRVVFGLEEQELSLDRRPCDLAALCQREAQVMQTTTEHVVHVELPPGPVMLSADPDRLGQVVTNLLSNADKYSPLERPITLTLRVEPLETAHVDKGAPQSVARSGAAAGVTDGAVNQQARVLIRDEGLGIPSQEQPHLWERFHRVPGTHARSGTGGSLGFGLYICRELIERHGGAIGVVSTPGKGSTFWFTLPLATEGRLRV